MIMMLHSSRNESARLVSGDLVAGERTGAEEDNRLSKILLSSWE